MVNRFCGEDKHILCADGQVRTFHNHGYTLYINIMYIVCHCLHHVHTWIYADRWFAGAQEPSIPRFSQHGWCWGGNTTPTIPHKYSQHQRSGFPVGICDSAAEDGRRGSNAYEVNPWLWQFGRGKPRLGGLSVEKTGAKKAAAQKERLLRGAETRRRRKADREWWEMKRSCEQAQTCVYSVHTYINIYVHTYINIYVHVCNMNIQQHKFMYMYVHCTSIRQKSCTCM